MAAPNAQRSRSLKNEWVQSSFGETFISSKKSGKIRKTSSQHECIEEARSITPLSTGNAHKSYDKQTLLLKYRPTTKEELCVHKKKIQEVEEWLLNHNNMRKASILLLTGPTGSGKTAIVETLAKELQLTVQEWVNPLSPELIEDDYSSIESQVTQFTNFLLRASRYPCIDIDNSSMEKKVLLVEDFPNIFHMDPAQFHDVVKRYASFGRNPIVFIVTDSGGSDSNERNLFPKKFQRDLNITNISFNPVAPTNMLKALKRIIALEEAIYKKTKLKSTPFSVPSVTVLQSICDNSSGDLRSAINALQFYCSKGPSFSQHVLPQRTRSKVKRAAPPSVNDNSISSVMPGGRDASLYLFHALGKVLHCKREPISCSSIPPHLERFQNTMLRDKPEEILDKTPLSVSTFIMFLHENYLKFSPSFDSTNRASAYLSDADLFFKLSMGKDMLEEFSGLVATYGIMNSDLNPNSPCKGWKPINKPQWYESNKRCRDRLEEVKSLFIAPCTTSVEQVTTIIPYTYKIKPNGLSQGQNEVLTKICTWDKRRIWNKLLGERDLPSLNEDDNVNTTVFPAVEGITETILMIHKEDADTMITEYSD